MQSKEEKLISLFAQATRFCEQVARFTRQARKLRLKARDLEKPSNPKANTSAAVELRKDAQKATTASRQQLGQLLNIKEEIETYLLAFAEPAKPFRKALADLSFNSHGFPNYPDSVDEDGILSGCQTFQQLAQVAVQTLTTPIETTEACVKAPSVSMASELGRPPLHSGSHPPYSDNDNSLCQRIGLENILRLPLSALWRTYRTTWVELRPKGTHDAFRACVYRARRYHAWLRATKKKVGQKNL